MFERVPASLDNARAYVIGPIPWGHSGPLCHALSLSSLWTSHAACVIAIAGVRLALSLIHI